MSRPTRRDFLRTAGLGAAAAMLPAWQRAAAAPARRMNVVMILADDLGWMDTTLYGSRYYETPNIERLARRGCTFSDAYAAAPICSPTRASLMTGKYPARLGITVPAGHIPPDDYAQPMLAARAAPWQQVISPRSHTWMRPEEYTYGEAFRDAGYATAHIGKWHLGLNPEHWPEVQGFEFVFHGAPDPGPPSYFSPYRFRSGTVTNGPDGEYITDRVTDEAIHFVEQHREAPFLLNLWHYAVHAPFQAKEALIEHYRAKTDPRGLQNCPTMGGMIQSLDEGIGRLLDRIDALGLADNTIILFMSDNGGNMYNTVDGTTPTNNAPLRGGKGSIYEGGTREPCIIVWPGVVEPGSRNATVLSSIDFYPTMLEMVGLSPQPNQLFDGESFVPVLKGTGGLKRQAIFCDFPHYTQATDNYPASYVRQGDWKLIRYYDGGRNRTTNLELYNLRDDLGERHNLAAAEPVRVKALDALLAQHLVDTQAAVPATNPAYNPKAFHPWYDQPIEGWVPNGTCGIEHRDGCLVVLSDGGDAQFDTTALPDHTGPLTFKVRMRSDSQGPGQCFYSTTAARPYHRDRSVGFEMSHDHEWHEYSLELAAKGKLLGLRLDPGTAPGTIEVDWVRIYAPDGTLLKAWEFDGP